MRARARWDVEPVTAAQVAPWVWGAGNLGEEERGVGPDAEAWRLGFHPGFHC